MSKHSTQNYIGQVSTPVAPQVQRLEFNASSTTPIAIPTWAKTMRLVLIGGGGGSGSGSRGNNANARRGGSSGSAGARSVSEYNLDQVAAQLGLPRSGLMAEVVIGQGGAAGGPVTTNDTDGIDGSSGGTSFFRFRNLSGATNQTFSIAPGGARGLGGRRNTTTTSGGGVIAGGTFVGAAGVAGTATTGSTGLAASNAASSGGSGAGGGEGPTFVGANIGTLSAPTAFTQNASSLSFTAGSNGTGIIGNASENFYFASTPYTPTTFDWTFSYTFSATQVGAQFGIMIRDGLANNAPFFAVYRENSTVGMGSRLTAGVFSVGITLVPPAAIIMRMTRNGNTYSGYYSINNGLTWVLIQSDTIAMTDPRIGFFSTSNSFGANTIVFSVNQYRFSAIGGSSSAPAPAEFGFSGGSTMPGANAPTNILPGCPGSGGGGGAYNPGAAGGSGGAGYRGSSGGGGGASENGFSSGGAGASGNGYALLTFSE